MTVCLQVMFYLLFTNVSRARNLSTNRRPAEESNLSRFHSKNKIVGSIADINPPREPFEDRRNETILRGIVNAGTSFHAFLFLFFSFFTRFLILQKSLPKDTRSKIVREKILVHAWRKFRDVSSRSNSIYLQAIVQGE